jgi:hypothetical protein
MESGFATGGTGAGRDEFFPFGAAGSTTSTGTVVANPAWWYSQGAFVLKFAASGGSQLNSQFGHFHGFKFGCDALPTSEQSIWDSVPMKVTIDQNRVIRLYDNSKATIIAQSPAGTIAPNTCYLIEINGTPNAHALFLNGVQVPSVAASSAEDLSLTNFSYFAFANSAAYFDDMYINSTAASASNQTGRRGWASVKALRPNADVGTSPAGFTNSGGLTFGNATTGWFSAVDDPPPFSAGSTDFLGKSTASTVVVELGFADTQVGETPTAVYVTAILSGATAASHDNRYTLRANGIDMTERVHTLLSSTPIVSTFGSDLASAGVAWTKALVDGTTLKWGSSTDVSPNPKLNAAYLMYEIAEADPVVKPKRFRSRADQQAVVVRAAMR